MEIRDANQREASALEALQRRSSDVWEEYRGQLAAHPDAIKLRAHFIDNGWTRVAVIGSDAPVGFSVAIPGPEGAYELDGLFVELISCWFGRTPTERVLGRPRCVER